MVERLGLEKPALPLERTRWIDRGASFDAGERTLRLFKPPVCDGPATRGLYDANTAAMWVVSTFARLQPGAVYDVHDVPRERVEETLPAFNSLVSPWHQWARPGRLPPPRRRHRGDGRADRGLGPRPVMTGDALHAAFDTVRDLAGKPNIPPPGQELLDELVAQILAGDAA